MYGKCLPASSSAAFSDFSVACCAWEQTWRGREVLSINPWVATSKSSRTYRNQRRPSVTRPFALVYDLALVEGRTQNRSDDVTATPDLVRCRD